MVTPVTGNDFTRADVTQPGDSQTVDSANSIEEFNGQYKNLNEFNGLTEVKRYLEQGGQVQFQFGTHRYNLSESEGGKIVAHMSTDDDGYQNWVVLDTDVISFSAVTDYLQIEFNNKGDYSGSLDIGFDPARGLHAVIDNAYHYDGAEASLFKGATTAKSVRGPDLDRKRVDADEGKVAEPDYDKPSVGITADLPPKESSNEFVVIPSGEIATVKTREDGAQYLEIPGEDSDNPVELGLNTNEHGVSYFTLNGKSYLVEQDFTEPGSGLTQYSATYELKPGLFNNNISLDPKNVTATWRAEGGDYRVSYLDPRTGQLDVYNRLTYSVIESDSPGLFDISNKFIITLGDGERIEISRDSIDDPGSIDQSYVTILQDTESTEPVILLKSIDSDFQSSYMVFKSNENQIFVEEGKSEKNVHGLDFIELNGSIYVVADQGVGQPELVEFEPWPWASVGSGSLEARNSVDNVNGLYENASGGWVMHRNGYLVQVDQMSNDSPPPWPDPFVANISVDDVSLMVDVRDLGFDFESFQLEGRQQFEEMLASGLIQIESAVGPTEDELTVTITVVENIGESSGEGGVQSFRYHKYESVTNKESFNVIGLNFVVTGGQSSISYTDDGAIV